MGCGSSSEANQSPPDPPQPETKSTKRAVQPTNETQQTANQPNERPLTQQLQPVQQKQTKPIEVDEKPKQVAEEKPPLSAVTAPASETIQPHPRSNVTTEANMTATVPQTVHDNAGDLVVELPGTVVENSSNEPSTTVTAPRSKEYLIAPTKTAPTPTLEKTKSAAAPVNDDEIQVNHASNSATTDSFAADSSKSTIIISSGVLAAANLAASSIPTVVIPAHKLNHDEIAACDEGELFVLKLSGPESDEELSVVHEMNRSCVKVADIKNGGPGVLNESIIALSWRWDIAKPKTLDEAKQLGPSPKILEAIRRSRASGFKYAWIDWMVVPQYPTDFGMTINHVRGSRLVYEKCSVMLVDLVEVVKGVKVATPDYISRLWTTAEMSSMLCNPHVNYSSFVRLERWTHTTITVCATGMFNGAAVRDNFVSEYLKFFRNNEVEHIRLSQDSIYVICVSFGMDYLSAKYGRQLPLWLASDVNRLKHPEPVPISEEEQEQLIQDYFLAGEKGHENEHINPILEAVQRSKKMPLHWDLTQHYRGYLLLAAEVCRFLLTHWRFNSGCYKSILQRLGETFENASPFTITAEDTLRCFSEGDVASVREMIMAARSRVKIPVAIPGVKFHAVPLNHVFSTIYTIPPAIVSNPTEPQISAILPHLTFVSTPSSDDTLQPLRYISTSMSLNEFTKGLISSIHFYTPQCRIGLTCNEVNGAVAQVECDDQKIMQQSVGDGDSYDLTLHPHELWFHLSFTYTDIKFVSKTLSLTRKSNMLTMAQVSQIVNAFQVGIKEFIQQNPVVEERLKAVQANEVQMTQMMLRACDSVGVGMRDVDPPKEDLRPEYLPEDVIEMAELKRLADEKAAAEANLTPEADFANMLRAFNMTPEVYKLLPKESAEQLGNSWIMMKKFQLTSSFQIDTNSTHPLTDRPPVEEDLKSALSSW